MKTKSIYLSLLLAIIFAGCCSSEKQVSSQELANYFVKNNYEPANDVNPVVITNQQAFDELFGMAQTMNNTIIVPDFEKSIVVGLILKTTNKSTTISLSKAEKEGSNLNVYFNVEIGSEQSFTMTPLKLEAFEKDPIIKDVRFFVNGNCLN